MDVDLRGTLSDPMHHLTDWQVSRTWQRQGWKCGDEAVVLRGEQGQSGRLLGAACIKRI